MRVAERELFQKGQTWRLPSLSLPPPHQLTLPLLLFFFLSFSLLQKTQAEAEPSAATPAEAEAAAAPAGDAPAAAAGSSSARFGLNFLWLDKNVGVAVDALYSRSGASDDASSPSSSSSSASSSSVARAPLTEYFMWPRKDAWEELKAALEAKSWVPERDRVLLLNRTTEVINFWQDEGAKHSVEEAREKFPDCVFSSS